MQGPLAACERGAVPAATCGSIPCTSAAFAELSSEILGAGISLRFRATGTSMSPLVRDGDLLLVRPAEAGMPGVGDLVLCTVGGAPPEQVVVHRVIRRERGRDGWRFTVQGDALSRPEGPIPETLLFGRVVTVERDGSQLDMDRPALRMLGWFAALRSRWDLGRGPRFRRARRLARRLPGLSKYVA